MQIDIHEVKKMIENSEVAVIDIRDQNSYNEAHIENAININKDTIGDFIKNTGKDRPIVCYCYRGISSQDAVRFLQKEGFKTVYSMDGGFEAWREEYPFVSE